LPATTAAEALRWVLAYLGILLGQALEQVVFHNRRAIVECWTDIRDGFCARSLGAEDEPWSGFGFQRPANGWLLASIFEYGRLESCLTRRPSRECKGLADMEQQRAVVDSSFWSHDIVPWQTNDVATKSQPQCEGRRKKKGAVLGGRGEGGGLRGPAAEARGRNLQQIPFTASILDSTSHISAFRLQISCPETREWK
jgi:hypothetical protein